MTALKVQGRGWYQNSKDGPRKVSYSRKNTSRETRVLFRCKNTLGIWTTDGAPQCHGSSLNLGTNISHHIWLHDSKSWHCNELGSLQGDSLRVEGRPADRSERGRRRRVTSRRRVWDSGKRRGKANWTNGEIVKAHILQLDSFRWCTMEIKCFLGIREHAKKCRSVSDNVNAKPSFFTWIMFHVHLHAARENTGAIISTQLPQTNHSVTASSSRSKHAGHLKNYSGNNGITIHSLTNNDSIRHLLSEIWDCPNPGNQVLYMNQDNYVWDNYPVQGGPLLCSSHCCRAAYEYIRLDTFESKPTSISCKGRKTLLMSLCFRLQ